MPNTLAHTLSAIDGEKAKLLSLLFDFYLSSTFKMHTK